MTKARRTKIVCTIGPASSTPEMLKQLIEAGMDVARLNFAHGTRVERAAVIAAIREISGRLGKAVAILQDLAGPKVRIGDLAGGPVQLDTGAAFTLTARDVPGDANEVSVSYGRLVDDVAVGDRLLLNDGALELFVERTSGKDVVCRVAIGGLLPARKGVNAPSSSLQVPFLTEKDKTDLQFGLEHGVDYVGLSFVRTADDIRTFKQYTGSLGAKTVPGVIAKIEKHEALERIDEILDEVDGIMIARGDLGVEIPIERVPGAQKMLIRKANSRALPVVTATQMLRSMVESAHPTRAEATDVVNAVLDGTDALMLSEETAQGAHPVEAVAVMDRLAQEAERTSLNGQDQPGPLASSEAVAQAAARLAVQVEAAAIITCTQSGSTTRLVSSMRPQTLLIAATPDEATRRRLALVWGAVPLSMTSAERLETMEQQAVDTAVEQGLVRKGALVVITAGLPLHESGTTNIMKVITA